MTNKQKLGAAMLATPFFGLFGLAVYLHGLGPALIAFSAIAAFVAFIQTAVGLVLGD